MSLLGFGEYLDVILFQQIIVSLKIDWL